MSNECMSLPPLKPCPFCGGGVRLTDVWEEKNGSLWFQVQCPHCGAMTDWVNGMASAINAWNRRAGESNE